MAGLVQLEAVLAFLQDSDLEVHPFSACGWLRGVNVGIAVMNLSNGNVTQPIAKVVVV